LDRLATAGSGGQENRSRYWRRLNEASVRRP